MFKLVPVALLIGLFAGCSGMPGSYGAGSIDGSNTATSGPPRSPGEGPSFTPYGAAGK